MATAMALVMTVYNDIIAVRPALHLNLSSSTLWSYAGKVTSEGGGGSSQETPKPAATEPPVVSDRDESLGTVTKGADLSLGSNKSGKLSAEVSEFFPANWSLGASVFPVTLSQKTKADGSYSVKMAIGVGKTNMLDSKTEWSRYKQVVNDAEKYASLTGLLYRYAPVKRSTYSVSKFNKMPSLSVVGYMEQEYDKYGNLISSTGKIAPELAWKASVKLAVCVADWTVVCVIGRRRKNCRRTWTEIYIFHKEMDARWKTEFKTGNLAGGRIWN